MDGSRFSYIYSASYFKSLYQLQSIGLRTFVSKRPIYTPAMSYKMVC